jgi:hypothetical protein
MGDGTSLWIGGGAVGFGRRAGGGDWRGRMEAGWGGRAEIYRGAAAWGKE